MIQLTPREAKAKMTFDVAEQIRECLTIVLSDRKPGKLPIQIFHLRMKNGHKNSE